MDRDRESASVFRHDHGSQRRGPEDETEAQESLDVAQGKVAVAPVREERIRAALAVCGKYRDPHGETRVAQEHDRYLEGVA